MNVVRNVFLHCVALAVLELEILFKVLAFYVCFWYWDGTRDLVHATTEHSATQL